MIDCSTKLLTHQKQAHDKLVKLKVGALFMDMGTGKTRTVLEIIKDKFNKGKVDKVLWFCPCSAKENIKRELEKQLILGNDLFLIVGIESLSSSIKLNSYLYDYVAKYRCILIVDESSKIKNAQAKRTQRLIDLGEKCKYKYILNGTPITRDERDLFSQFYFLDWRILGYKSEWSFEINHVVFHKEYKNKVVGTRNTEYLARKIAPYTYQVKLDDCVELPGKVYKKEYFDLNNEQKEMYDFFSEYLLEQVDEWDSTTIYRLFSTLQAITAGFVIELTDDEKIIKKSFLDTPETNPRLQYFLDRIAGIDGKVIIFCEFQIEVECITRELNKIYGEGAAVMFYGKTKQKERDKNIKKFQLDDNTRFLVASKDCGAYSHNLQFCHQIIYYNNDFDYGTRSQSEDRVYRIGQNNRCVYLDIVASDTLEEYIVDCLLRKERLADRFKREVEHSKDKRAAELIISRRNSKGRRKRGQIKEVSVDMVGDLIESV